MSLIGNDDSKEYAIYNGISLRQYSNIPLQLVFRCGDEQQVEVVRTFLCLLGYQKEVNSMPGNVYSYKEGWRYWYSITKKELFEEDSNERCGLFFYTDTQEEYDLIITTFINTFKDDTRRKRQTRSKSIKATV